MKAKIKELIPYVIIIIAVILIRSFIVTPVEVVGTSMDTTLKDGQLLFLNKISYKFNDLKRFDIVVIHINNEDIIKRVIGLPGETVSYRDNKLYINDQEVADNYAKSKTKDFDMDIMGIDVIPKDKYLVLGDNRIASADSRVFGLMDIKDIMGTVKVRFWPLDKIGIVK